MACSSPIRAWRSELGNVSLREPLDKDVSPYTYLLLPCGQCLGCGKARAREWAFRCSLELQDHDSACWVTLTYDRHNLPPTLSRIHLSEYLKRLRSRVSGSQVRFFGCGEYGESSHRPHYHVILYGLPLDNKHVEAAWPFGFARADPLTPAAISYVAGYCSKKLGGQFYHRNTVISEESVDEDGVWSPRVLYQPPFLQMSRRPGIGGSFRQYWQSWRLNAIHQGRPIPVPRFLHQAWLSNSSPSDHEVLAKEKSLLPRADCSPAALRARAAHAATLHSHSSSSRHL